MIDQPIPIILASASPRRSELLKQAGFSFTVVPSTIEETRTETAPGHGEVLGKPADEQEAFDMLKLLSDRTHQVYTGLAIILKKDGEKQIHLLHERTDVTFYPISDEELKDYIATGDPLDKAGAYGIQGAFAVHVKEIKGDYNNVVGLPLARLYQTIKH